MAQVLEQIAGAIITLLLAFFLVFVFGSARMATRGKYSRAHDQELWGANGAPRRHRKGEEAPRYTEPLPAGRAYGDNKREKGIPKKASLTIIVVAALVALALIYFMPDMTHFFYPSRRERPSWPIDKGAATAFVIVSAVTATVTVLVSGGGKSSNGNGLPDQSRDAEEVQRVQTDWEEAQRRRRKAKRRLPGGRRI